MKITRKALAALGIESDKIDQIMEMHTEVTDGMKETISILEDENKKYKADAEKLSAVQKEFDGLKEKVATDAKEREGKDYDKLKQEFENYKAEQENKAVRASKETAYKAILKDAGIPERHFAKILKYSDVDSVELDDKGNAKNAKDLMKTIKEEWSDHEEKTTEQGAQTETPPDGSGKGGKSVDEIMNIKDTAERQKAIAENIELFS